MIRVVTPEQMRCCDRRMIEELGIPEMLLMEHAALAVADAATRALEARPGRVLILSGAGNNGGDGLAALRILCMRGTPARALLFGDAKALKGAALENYALAQRLELSCVAVQDGSALEREWDDSCSIIIDALFGTGLSREVTGLCAAAIEKANRAEAYRIAVDIPSGVHAGTGRILGSAFRAHETVTFQMAKRGHLLYPGRGVTGTLHVAPIGYMPKEYWQEYADQLLEQDDVKALLPPRPHNSNKGDNGRALLIAGSNGLSGAAIMASCSALRGGVGLLRVAVPRGAAPAFSQLPEAMAFAASEGEDWDATSADAVRGAMRNIRAAGIGPGLGSSKYIPALVRMVLECGCPAVIDADGLNALSQNPELMNLLHPKTVLTPHALEMSRLCGLTLDEVLSDPAAVAHEAAKRWNTVVALKGATSVIASPEGTLTFNLTGNPGLAKGGSGDVLTGLVLALLSQGLPAYDAACAGAYLLGCAADRAMELLGERALLAGDVIAAIGER
ncbi:MAG: NAD(P)H-hydrate dehydratase [Bacillota bacterium]